MATKAEKQAKEQAEVKRLHSVGIEDQAMKRTLYWDEERQGWTWRGDPLGPVTKSGNHKAH